ncbi:MAG TPA: T9SS type A sorting domain-containing protein, partial [Flavobacteriales bacterium]|nr:T9SS type A sorting domain-containing protein [Flavobacteriales bacterium]
FHGNQIIRLSAINDELAAVVLHDIFGADTFDLNWSKVQTVNGEPVWLVGSGSKAMHDMRHDSSGTLVLLTDALRSYSPTGWPIGVIPTDRASRMALLENSLVLGVAPSIARIDRTTLTALTPITVPSSGTAVSGVCQANGNTAFNYATVNTNGTIDLGLADIGSGLVWNTVVTVPSGTEPTAYHVDEQGDFWIAFSHIEAGLSASGLLYGFSPLGAPSPVGSYGRSIDDIASGGAHLFLTGRQAGDMTSTYLAAFSTEFTMGSPSAMPGAMPEPFPNPASQTLSINNVTREVESISVKDAMGRTLKRVAGPFGTTINFSVADLAPGAYFVRLDGRAGTTTLPFQVSH